MPLPPIPGSNYIGRKAAEKLIANAPTLAEVYMLQQEQLPIALQTREVLDLVQVALKRLIRLWSILVI